MPEPAFVDFNIPLPDHPCCLPFCSALACDTLTHQSRNDDHYDYYYLLSDRCIIFILLTGLSSVSRHIYYHYYYILSFGTALYVVYTRRLGSVALAFNIHVAPDASMQPTTLHSKRRTSLLLLAATHPFLAHADVSTHDRDPGLHRFVTHPEIKAPRWNVKTTRPDLVSPGYWFVAPFEDLSQAEPAHGWVGPHIYDGDGELVWSGVSLSRGWNVIDFKMSNVRGEDKLTFLVHRDGDGFIVNQNLELEETVDLGIPGEDFNSHEFYFIDDGSKAIVLDEIRRDATPEQALAVEHEDYCKVLFQGFKVLDTKTWEPLFDWSSFDHIGLEESSFVDGGVDLCCMDDWGWDYVHLNAVDQDHNGDFYVSARHTDTIYKVSKDDGHIMWRLNGRQADKGDWDMAGLSFSRQHNVRFRGFNGTHEFITILDNAHGQDDQPSTYWSSRGLNIALDVGERKVARIVSSIDMPAGKGWYAPRRGNYQVLPNGNIFMGWSEQATQSEHTENGTLVMEASLAAEWLGTYRSYKFPFLGRPSYPPKAFSAAYSNPSQNTTSTIVHASWNGATEVASWKLYETTEIGTPMIQMLETRKTGFETAMVWDGFASYVIVEAVDKSGEVIGRTNIIETIDPPEGALSAAVADEIAWMQEALDENEGASRAEELYYESASGDEWSFVDTVLIFFFGIACSVVGILSLLRLKGRGMLGFRWPRYRSISDWEEEHLIEKGEGEDERVSRERLYSERRRRSS